MTPGPAADSANHLSATQEPGSLTLLDDLEALQTQFEALEPQIHAFLPEPARFRRLRAEARELVSRFPDQDSRPALWGLPSGIKDIFHVAGFLTRAGSQVPPEELGGPEAVAVARLKAAGALVLGKTVTTEFAYFAPGPTRNPRNPDHTPGGSSSGSAAAVAAGFCPLAMGTQTIGSIIRPAAFCGVLGFKPSYDRIPRDGVIPLAPSVDHVGIFTSELRTMRTAAGALCGDWKTLTAVRRPVLGIPEGPYLARAEAAGMEEFRRVCQRLEAAGYSLRSVPALVDFDAVVARHNLIVAGEAARTHRRWFARYPDSYHPRTAELVRSGQEVAQGALDQALSGRIGLRDELTALMESHRVDLWICPSAPGPAPRGLASTGDPVMNLPWTHAGMPALNLPSGANSTGLPFGLQVVARFQADEMLLAWAEDLVSALGSQA